MLLRRMALAGDVQVDGEELGGSPVVRHHPAPDPRPAPPPAVRRPRTDRTLVLCDVVLVAAAYVLALLLRFDGRPPAAAWSGLVPLVALAVTAYVLTHRLLRLYGQVWRHAGVTEAWRLLGASAAVTTLMVVTDLLLGRPRDVPLSVPVDAGTIALILLGGVRFQARWRAARHALAPTGTPVLVLGPPAAARATVEHLRNEPSSGLRAVAVVTDDPTAWGRRMLGLPVVGPLAHVGRHAHAHAATQALLVPDALSPDRLAEVLAAARAAGVTMRRLPTLLEAMDRRRGGLLPVDLPLQCLLGRTQVDVDEHAVRGVVTGRRVLITGAGGSIGSEIAAQVSRLSPAELVLLDHDETHLHDAVAGVVGPVRSVLGDIRDEAFVDELFLSVRPEVVFHAAAHKHVPILEAHPSEAVRTNVHGTDVVAGAAVRAGTQRLVVISTDKAVAPSSVMGATKRIAEQLVVHRDGPGRHFCAVRFGNVLGSRGSVVPTFVRQVSTGGPVTVTHPGMTRYFMTTAEAVSLVMQAVAISDGGEVFLLDMGAPVPILALAEQIIGHAGLVPGQDIDITYTGMRPGEKLEEELTASSESVTPTEHPQVLRVASSLTDRRLLEAGVAELCRRAWAGHDDGTRSLLFELARMPEEVRLDGEVVALLRHAERLPEQLRTTGSAAR